MDGSRFDALARSLTGHRTRRGVLAGVLAGLVGIRANAAGPCPGEQVLAASRRCVCRTTGRPPVGGGCPCPVGQTRCPDGACHVTSSFQSDPANCGACGAACPAGNPCTSSGCTNGACVATPLLANGAPCGPAQVCSGGACVANATGTCVAGTDHCTAIDGVACAGGACVCLPSADGVTFCANPVERVCRACTADAECAAVTGPGSRCVTWSPVRCQQNICAETANRTCIAPCPV